ncbi:DUF4041 domain-containing protein [Scardovia wiggsiae]|uniref:DUF4041 domain-containing protein n=1 Tax=Scardovia wiggsiae TaxID=230143 RepID=UPI003625BCE3
MSVPSTSAQQSNIPIQSQGIMAPDAKVPFLGRKKLIEQLYAQINQLNAQNIELTDQIQNLESEFARIGGMSFVERENKAKKIDNEIKQKLAEQDKRLQLREDASNRQLKRDKNELTKIKEEISRQKEESEKIQANLINLRLKADVEDQGLYDFENPAEDSIDIRWKLDDIKARQKEMLKDKTATRAITAFTFNGSASSGTKFIRDLSQMAISLYNAEAENAVKSVKAGNLDISITRLTRCADRIEKFGKMINLQISREYQKLRIKELTLTALYMQQVQVEKEAEKERRAELREEQKAQKEFEAEMARLRKEQEHYQNALNRMKEIGDTVKAAELESKLNDINRSIDDVDYRAANIRAGYVYVISDIGAFGERMVKIGMTRRLEPMDRIRELSDASVPFKFDVHALFFSKDAVTLETMLHHEFEAKRVNKVNTRKEFFYCTPQEVLDKLKEKDVAIMEYKIEPEAEEYRISQSITTKESERK